MVFFQSVEFEEKAKKKQNFEKEKGTTPCD
jgi:hypothetical protein